MDRCHPFAVTLDGDGALCATASWSHLIAPPNAWHYPRRRLLHLDATSVAVHDFGATTAARLVVGPGGSLDVHPARLAGLSWREQRYVPPRRAGTSTVPGPGWVVGNDRRRHRWSWWAVHPAVAAPAFGPHGPILDWAALSGDAGIAVVRHAQARPLDLRPRAALHLLDTRRYPPDRVLPAVALPGTARWTVDPERADDRQAELTPGPQDYADARAAAITTCRDDAERSARRLLELGYTDASVTLPDGPDAPDPRVVLEFGSPEHPDRSFRRVDRPLDELGHPGGGLRDLGVVLDEDLSAGLVGELAERDPGAGVVHF
ncbi:hypothetical protein [Pseudonocardia sp. HH130630-07]|uniref:hypothetical protein n=1 Tax=Pseudonocardia sp. HH130630-07 TaxID=1690815 RepID=UPI0012E9B5E4|nr:hypothetical protein [Pseudonocardia sp. HH130630-07]